MKKIFDDMNAGPFKARVDERFHKLGQDCPDDGWVEGYLYRDLCGSEMVPIIFNAPCRWRVREETIEPIGFHIAKWIKVEDRLPEEGDYVLIYYKPNITGIACYYEMGGWFSDYDEEIAVPDYWQEIVPPKED